MECLGNVVGLTRTTCECFSGEFSDQAAISTSGRYIDELSEFPIKLSTIKAGTGICEGLEQKMINARANAIATFKEALFKAMSARFSQTAEPYNGLIGGNSYTKNLPIGYAYAGSEWEAKRMPGATLTIKQIDTFFAQDATLNVLVILDGNVIETIPVQSTANAKKQNVLTTPVSLPLTDQFGEPYKYRFVYATAGLTPKDNTIGCGCGSEAKLDKYFSRKGVTLSNLADKGALSNYAYGLSFFVNISCGSDELICEAFNNDPFFRVAAEAAIQRKAVEFLIIDLMSSKTINRDTMIDRDRMGVNGKILHNKFNQSVQWMAENMKAPQGGCFACAPQAKTFSIGGIRF
ncbi:MAG: hypothetical protein ACTHLE_04115 [Agriterribacter sp.]